MAALREARDYTQRRRLLNHQERIEFIEDALDEGLTNEVLAKRTDAPFDFYWRDVGDVIGGAGGIMFDTDPQDGNWLVVHTTGFNLTDFYGISLRSDYGISSAITDAGSFVVRDSQGATMLWIDGPELDGLGFVGLNAGTVDGFISIDTNTMRTTATGLVEFYTGGFYVDEGSGGFANNYLGLQNGNIQLGVEVDWFQVSLQPSTSFEVISGVYPNPVLFSVDEDGTIFPSMGGGGGIDFNMTNSGTWLRVEATGDSPGAYAVPSGAGAAAVSANDVWSVGFTGSQIALGADDLVALFSASEIAVWAEDLFTVYDGDGNSALEVGFAPPDANLTVNTYGAGADGYGVEINTYGLEVLFGDGAVFLSGDSDVYIEAQSGGYLGLYNDGDVHLHSTNPAGSLNLLAYTGSSTVGFNIDPGGELISSRGGEVHRLPVGGSVEVVTDSLATIFRIDDDGVVHILTGTSIVADL